MTVERPAILIELERRRQEAIRRAFTRLNPFAFGAGFAALTALGLFSATAILLVKGPTVDLRGVRHEVGANLWLLCQVFPGYAVSWPGAAVGALYGALVGFVLGTVVASARNLSLRVVLWRAVAAQRRWRRRHLLDEV